MNRRQLITGMAGAAVAIPTGALAAKLGEPSNVYTVDVLSGGGACGQVPCPTSGRVPEPPPDDRTPEQVAAEWHENMVQLLWCEATRMPYPGYRAYFHVISSVMWFPLLAKLHETAASVERKTLMGYDCIISKVNGDVFAKEPTHVVHIHHNSQETETDGNTTGQQA